MRTFLLLFLLPLLPLWGQTPATVRRSLSVHLSRPLSTYDILLVPRTERYSSPPMGLPLSTTHYLLGVSPPRTLLKCSSVFARHNSKGRYLSIAIMALTVQGLWLLCIALSTTAGVSPQLKKKCSKAPMAIIVFGKTWKLSLLKKQ